MKYTGKSITCPVNSQMPLTRTIEGDNDSFPDRGKKYIQYMLSVSIQHSNEYLSKKLRTASGLSF